MRLNQSLNSADWAPENSSQVSGSLKSGRKEYISERLGPNSIKYSKLLE
jgi:hypothetical protein